MKHVRYCWPSEDICRRIIWLFIFLCSPVLAQEAPSVNYAPATAKPQGPPTFESKVNLVLVPVLVRDAQGRAVGNLTKDDFELFDKGKQQTIGSFSMVKRDSSGPEGKTAATAPNEGLERAGVTAARSTPQRHLVYLFDDLHLNLADMAAVREAAVRHLKRALASTDRAAIFTVSGHPTLEFTGDRAKLEETARTVGVHAAYGHPGRDCPDASYFLADLIVIQNDQRAFQALVQQTASCMPVPPPQAEIIAWAAAVHELFQGEQETQMMLRTLRNAIRRLAEMPGQRLIVLASPGFLVRTEAGNRAMSVLLDQAAKANVTINTLDARGVYMTEPDASGQGPPTPLWTEYRRMSAGASNDVLAELSEGTGGTFFHGNNDLAAGLDRVAAAPEFSYVLGFSPADLKEDGSFHFLRVRLPNQKGVSIEARHGYYAITQGSEEQTVKTDVDEAVFSRAERNEIPVTLETRYSKGDADHRKLTVTAKVDVRSLHFQKTDGRNRDSLTLVSALFGADGGYVAGTTKTVNLRLLDQTMAHMDSGVTVPFEFDIRPGAYALRLVVREAEGGAISTRSVAVKIH
jgi:VWFA-related protein